jgi:hypothetical protein
MDHFNWRLLIICVLSALMSGCIGIHVSAVNECETTVPMCDYEFSQGSWGPIERPKTNTQPVPNYLLPKTEFIARWGEPTEVIVLSDNEVTLVYKRPDVWCGATAFWVIIPAPVMAPGCEIFDRITFKGERATHLHFQREDEARAFLLPAPWADSLKRCPKPCPPEIEALGPP